VQEDVVDLAVLERARVVGHTTRAPFLGQVPVAPPHQDGLGRKGLEHFDRLALLQQPDELRTILEINLGVVS